MTEPTQAVTPEGQEPQGQPEPGQTKTETLTPEQLREQLTAANNEAAATRRKLRDAEKQLADAAKAKADAEAAKAAEQGEFQKLYETERQKAAEYEARLQQMEHDQQRRDAAQAAGIPSLWQRLQGSTPEELAEDAAGLAALMQPAAPHGQTPRPATQPTPAPQGAKAITDEERRRLASRTI